MKRIIYIALSLFTYGQVKAQQTPQAFRDPVSFKLKTGLTIIVAENQSSDKIYSGFSVDTDSTASVDKIGMIDLMSRVFNVSSEKGEFKPAFLRMFSALRSPVINEDTFGKFKTHLHENLKTQGHPYGELVTDATIDRLQLNDLKEFYSKYINSSGACLTITGGITPAEAKELVQKALAEDQKDLSSADVEILNNFI